MSFSMRFVPAFLGALLITVAVFLFMQSLIQGGRDKEADLVVYTDVQVFRPEPETEEPEALEDAPETPREEPTMDSMDVMQLTQVSEPSPQPTTDLDMPALDLGVGDINVQAVGQSWRAPMGATGLDVGGGGADAQGYVEVVPFDTRKPNVPEAAWHNRINGWVLVAFAVTPQGRTRDVRVLDARPRGVFEDKVVAAVEDWQYSVSKASELKGTIILTQRVEVRWEDYPMNIPYVD